MRTHRLCLELLCCLAHCTIAWLASPWPLQHLLVIGVYARPAVMVYVQVSTPPRLWEIYEQNIFMERSYLISHLNSESKRGVYGVRWLRYISMLLVYCDSQISDSMLTRSTWKFCVSICRCPVNLREHTVCKWNFHEPHRQFSTIKRLN